MKIFGIQIPFTKAIPGDTNVVTPMREPYQIGTAWGVIGEAFGGMWQRNLRLDNTQSLLAFGAVFSCISLISNDVAKLRLVLRRLQPDKTWMEVESTAFSPVLRKPNLYQTRFQFVKQWMLMKLIWGNTYVWKERDARGVVTRLHVLDSQRCKPLVAPDGSVFYELKEDWLAQVGTDAMAIPASEIIHDRAECLFHPLIGVPPLYACALSGTQGRKIQTQSSKFFDNMSRPSGHLTAPGRIDEETAARLRRDFEANMRGDNIGRILVTGSDMKWESFSIPAEQAQLIEQLGWSVEDVARAYHVPLYKIGAQKDVKVDPAMGQEYYDSTLHPHIQSFEELLDEGMALPPDIMVEVDVDELLRLDPKTRFDRYEVGVRSAVLKPNEARAKENLPDEEGGDSLWLQQQNWPLGVLEEYHEAEVSAKTAPPPPPVAPPSAPTSEPTDGEDVIQEAMEAMTRKVVEDLRW